MIEIVWTIKPSRILVNVGGAALLSFKFLVGLILLPPLPPLGLRIGPVVPQIVAISTVPSIPSKLQNEIKNGTE